ncbi:MAG: PHP domain-containing protein [Saccharofermentanales bacterium]
MLLTETHLHTKEVSGCATVSAVEIPKLYKDAGFGALIVTDHFNRWTLENLTEDADEQTTLWLEGYHIVKRVGEAIGMKVFLGMELTLAETPGDYLIYGIEEEFLDKYPRLYEHDFHEIHEIAIREGLLIYQAHPFRGEPDPSVIRYLDGVEVCNGNPRHNSRNGKAMEFAERNLLLKIAGSDFHQYEDLGRGGIYLPDSIEDSRQLVAYFRSSKAELFMAEA